MKRGSQQHQAPATAAEADLSGKQQASGAACGGCRRLRGALGRMLFVCAQVPSFWRMLCVHRFTATRAAECPFPVASDGVHEAWALRRDSDWMDGGCGAASVHPATGGTELAGKVHRRCCHRQRRCRRFSTRVLERVPAIQRSRGPVARACATWLETARPFSWTATDGPSRSFRHGAAPFRGLTRVPLAFLQPSCDAFRTRPSCSTR